MPTIKKTVTTTVTTTTTEDITNDPAYAHFQSIVSNVETHVIHSSEALKIYTNIVQTFWKTPSSFQRHSCPTQDEVLHYFSTSFPIFVSWTTPDDTWGMVEKGSKENEVMINSKLMDAAAHAVTNPNDFPYPSSHFEFLLVVTILHELSHALTKHFFEHEITSPSIQSTYGNNEGESGWYLEQELLGGFVTCQWRSDQKFDMKNIRKLEYEPADQPGTYYAVDFPTVDVFLDSLHSQSLRLPNPKLLQQSALAEVLDSNKSVERYRVGMDASEVSNTTGNIGLGIHVVRCPIRQDRF